MEESKKNAFDRVLLARHLERPHSIDIFNSIFTDFVEVHGDRRYADDPALICGFAKLEGTEVTVIGHQKGRDLNQRRYRNFGMPKPEGYRKALRVMHLAEKFSRPIITLVDTTGAYPGIDAEERGQAEAIAYNLREMVNLNVPIIVVVLGEGGSGGALAIAVGDRVLMMENSVYSVISPEGCAAILWKDATKAEGAANNLRLTAEDLIKMNIIDEIISEPSDWKVSAKEEGVDEKVELVDEISLNLKNALVKNLAGLLKIEPKSRKAKRFKKFRDMGRWVESTEV